jgi:Mg-chelatase subunit ChlD
MTLHPLPEMEGVIVSIQPPKGKSRTPCDIVLVIDVSGSMSAKAPSPQTAAGEIEVNGLTVLDLTKHAARAIVETLDGNDRLGIVTFSDEVRIVQRLKPMTKLNKSAAWNNIKNIRADGLTNLWQGILQGRSLFDDEQRPGSVPALMLLTDGAPNVG